MTAHSVGNPAGDGSRKLHNDNQTQSNEWSPPKTADGAIDWPAIANERPGEGRAPPRFLSPEQERERDAKVVEDYRKGEEAAQKREEAALKREMLKRGLAPDAPTGPRQLVGRALGEVRPRSIDWLWVGWIPKGYITLIAGETGAGKSTVLADVMARLTTGAPWPGEQEHREPGRILWLGSEDSVEEMLVPRLMACGANLANVVEIQGVVQQGQRNTFSMQDDLEAVSQWLAYARDEQGQPFALLVIDPVTSYLPGQKLRKVDLNDAGHLRSVLEPWLVLAQKYRIAIVCVTHFAKDTSRAMLHRVLGSAAFAQTCRSLLAVIERPVPEDEEPEPHAKAMLQVKINLPEHPGGAWKFSTVKVEVTADPESGKPIYATRPEWEELDSALTPQSAVGKSRGPVSKYEMPFGMWLKAYFANHPPEHWLRVDLVKTIAVAEKVVSDSWWEKHSHTFLEKRNDGGFWFCRPKASPYETW